MKSILKAALVALVLAGVVGTHAAQPFSHEDWNRVLERFVDDRGRVDYEGLAGDREVFDRYVAAVEAVSPKSEPGRFPSRDEALAYYINAYNALVFDGVLNRGPETESVWRGGPISGLQFFVKMKVIVGGESMSLKQLEDKIIREQFADPRIHAALNCASVSCPRLPREAFEAERLDEQLDAAMAEFVNSASNVAVDPKAGSLTLSKIFDWFVSDFKDFERDRGSLEPSLIDYVNRYRAPGNELPRGLKIRFSKYDKGINSQGS